MAESERVLLQRFVETNDGEAFAQIIHRHASLVYGTCLRVLADADQAADATQETFFQLVKKAHEVRGSLGGWLHRVAARKAVDLVRADSIRRRREDRHAEALPETRTVERTPFQLDLSSPETTVRSFTRAWVSGDPESILACWLPTAGDYEDVRRAACADPNDPGQKQYAEGKRWFQSLDPDAEMPIVSTEQTADGGTKVVWRVTLKKDATAGNQTFRAGDTHDIEVTLRRAGDSWLIDNM
ncbi:MAG: hypothetical protein MUC88_18165 [Planctomycetes bacterium]|nr:hypothetical protein [Planctomycetota bacterium]